MTALTRRATWTVLTVAAGLVISGCSGNAGTDQVTIPTTADSAPATVTTPEPAATSVPASEPDPEEQAAAEAQAALEGFTALVDELYADPVRDLAELEDIAVGEALDWAVHYLTHERDRGHVQTGNQVLATVTVTDVEIGSDTESGYPTVRFATCIDLTGVDVLDEDGQSVVAATRPNRVAIDYTTWNTGSPDNDHWVVAETGWLRDTPEVPPEC